MLAELGDGGVHPLLISDARVSDPSLRQTEFGLSLYAGTNCNLGRFLTVHTRPDGLFFGRAVQLDLATFGAAGITASPDCLPRRVLRSRQAKLRVFLCLDRLRDLLVLVGDDAGLFRQHLVRLRADFVDVLVDFANLLVQILEFRQDGVVNFLGELSF
ncbi:Uncharacterised protein [Mycobacteroides abscessus]|nr:Uncharacterised protein [Mycobacteroides abscessus]